MNRRQIEQILSQYPIQNYTILSYGFMSGSSNYRVRVQNPSGGRISFLFRDCIEAYTQTPEELKKQTQSEELESADELEGLTENEETGDTEFDHELGWFYVEESKRAREWNLRLPFTLHEVRIHKRWLLLSLIFYKLDVKHEEPSTARVNVHDSLSPGNPRKPD